jgi:tetratricopeptide (TPR) repeat protein
VKIRKVVKDLSQKGGTYMGPLCFILMPFGRKTDASGTQIDFDAVYQDLIVPAILEAGLEPIRADEEMTGGIIHKPMFERLILCEYAVADLTTANANVFYELGVRHAVRPRSTVLVFSEGGSQLPFDVAPLRAMPYQLGPDGKPVHSDQTHRMLTDRLIEAREVITDSPLFQLVDDYPDIDHTRTDIFRDQVAYSAEMKKKLAEARKKGVDVLRQIEEELGDIRNVESGVVIDLFLSFRAVNAWAEMIGLANKMCVPLASTIMVQEQLGFALNRAGRGEEAEQVLLKLIKTRGPSSETYGILGRVYKDRWETAVRAGKKFEARGLLEKAIDAYRRGFETDWRDAYPGINAITLMELKEPPDPEREKMIPVVTYAVERKMAAGEPDYWDHATMLELAVFARDQHQAEHHLGNALAYVREVWEPETTARNLRLIREARQARNEVLDWAVDVEQALLAKAGKEEDRD